MNQPMATRRLSVDPENVCALGYAVYAFSFSEWGAVWLAETLKPKYIQTELRSRGVEGIKKKPAGKIADDLKTIIEEASGRFPELHIRLKEFQVEFKALVRQRNNLLHANPHTAKGGEQRLLHLDRSDWTIAEIDERARRFEVASVEAGALRSLISKTAQPGGKYSTG
jgi:hypothetical protein